MYDILAIVALLGTFVGLFFVVFKKGKRLKGLGGFFICFIVFVVAMNKSLDNKAQEAGWQSADDKMAAEQAGITDPKEFEARRDALAAEKAAEKARKEAAAQEAQRAADARQAAEDAFYDPPAAQKAFVAAIEDARSGYEDAQNDLAKGGVRRERAKALCAAQPSSNVVGWTGTITQLTTNGDGLGVVYVEIADDVAFNTMNNAFSDIGSDTLIDPDTTLFAKLSSLSEGQKVRFSGTLLRGPNNTDCFYETSMTMAGSMRDPEFVFRFSDIEVFE